jgi:regulator of RNase E activity RraA
LNFDSNPSLLSNSIIERANRLNSTVLSDAMGCTGAMEFTIKPVSPKMKVVGTALTVDMRPGDNLFLHQAIVNGDQGYVIVADGKGHTGNAFLGELMAEGAKVRGLEGIIIDGAVRDYEALLELDFPIFAKGYSPNGPHKDGPGQLNMPISCGGVSVQPGDLVVGDVDGVVVVTNDRIEDVLLAAERKLEYENKRKIEIRNGYVEPSWLKSKIGKFEQ